MVIYTPTDIASRLVKDFVTLHYMAFERGVAISEFFYQFLEGRALKNNLCFGMMRRLYLFLARGSVDLTLRALIL